MAPATRLTIRVTPRAGRDEITGLRAGALLVRLKAPPVEGAANEALVRFLAERLSLAKSDVAIHAGHRSRTKQVIVSGLSPDELWRRLGMTPTPGKATL